MVITALVEEDRVQNRNMTEQGDSASRRNSCGGPSEDENPNEENSQENDDFEGQEVESSLAENDEDTNEPEESADDEQAVSSCNSGHLEDTHCDETIPSSDSNKENFDSNNYVEFDPSDYIVTGEHNFGEYDNADQIPLPQLLKIHVKQLVSGFEYGEATKRRAQENMKTARDKNKSETRKSEELAVTDFEKELENTNVLLKPCSSKSFSEVEHKTPHSRKRQRLTESQVNTLSSDKADFSKATRRVPDCLQNHSDCKEVWMYMIFKEEASLKLRNPRLFTDFKSVTPRMRAILLDWLMEVAAVYHLRRVTYYLSVDYFDRFLSIRPDIPKSLLQLVGITCLYIAAKVEEIYPPNLSEFSYVCDGACQLNEMVSCELLILNSLGWEVVLTTPSDWLNLYMQLHFKSSDVVRTSLSMDFNKDFIFPQYSAYQFTRASQLMDLLSLDPGFLKFGYSVIAAAAMYYMYGEKVALAVSGLSWEQLQPCVDYMEVFSTIVKDTPDPRLHSCLGGPHPEDSKFSSGLLKRIQSAPQNENYSFQTHVASMDYFEKATIFRLSRYKRQKEYLNPENILEEISSVKPDTPDSAKVDLANSENEGEEHEDAQGIGSENIDSTGLVHSLEELARNEPVNQDVNNDENLMSLDEIFELILGQDESKNTNLE